MNNILKSIKINGENNRHLDINFTGDLICDYLDTCRQATSGKFSGIQEYSNSGYMGMRIQSLYNSVLELEKIVKISITILNKYIDMIELHCTINNEKKVINFKDIYTITEMSKEDIKKNIKYKHSYNFDNILITFTKINELHTEKYTIIELRYN